VTAKEKAEMMKEFRIIKARENEFRLMSNAVLLHNRDEDFDWLRIASQTVRKSNLQHP
jgi:hypothetical protein